MKRRDRTRLAAVLRGFRKDPRPVPLTLSGDDDWIGWAGYHFVNVVMYFCSTRPLPQDLLVEDVWLDELGEPVSPDD
jgi:hypothetical protein